MTEPAVATATQSQTDKAFELHLAGVPRQQIVALTHLSPEEVDDATWARSHGRALETARLDRLWSVHYPKALKGDDKSTQICLRVVKARSELFQQRSAPTVSEAGQEIHDDPLGSPEAVQEAWRILAGGAQHAARALIDVARYGHSEIARVQASQAVLDRVGLGVHQDITFRTVPSEFDPETKQTVDPVKVVIERLRVLGELSPPDDDEDGIVEAELEPTNGWDDSDLG